MEKERGKELGRISEGFCDDCGEQRFLGLVNLKVYHVCVTPEQKERLQSLLEMPSTEMRQALDEMMAKGGAEIKK